MMPSRLNSLIFRPVMRADLPGLERLAAAAGPGIGSLRNDGLPARLEASLQGFATDDGDVSGEESYWFVLEDTAAQRLIGCSGITARAGYGSRFYAYRNEFVVASSTALGLSQRTHTLHPGHDLTGATLLTAFYIEPDAPPEAAQLLSRARLLFIWQFRQRFSDRIVAEFPGLLDAQGRSPFWDAVGRRFFGMDYPQAEHLAGGRSKAFIAELMPQSPVYVPLLPEAAQMALGQLHPDGELPFDILEQEGFDADSYVDMFDGGPTAEGRLQTLRTVRAATPLHGAQGFGAEPGMACSAQREAFQAVLCQAADAPALGHAGGLFVPLNLQGGAA
jgi:arginine N-succinyltransferase